jgi:hypothetical protein
MTVRANGQSRSSGSSMGPPTRTFADASVRGKRTTDVVLSSFVVGRADVATSP